ncbi:PH domain-containing protein [Litchfieldia alkalitelluris]|uniref:PH domain-containing protein n=1 Tax=Litchfieldia alkalitelluris TaxID=304268 RepID=UPI0009975B33|nr:PH domain-containing protein [Litchfieldia alkalitelluris]
MRGAPKNQISERALPAWRISALITSAVGWIAVIGVLVLTYLFEWPYWIVIIIFIASVLETIITVIFVPKIKWKRWRYEVLEHEIDIQQGVFVVRRTTIPMIRVQHVDTYQGPILRAHKLASVTISTAATVHEIPALDLEEADHLRDLISKLAMVNDDDV